jgi:hypothetical protein
VNECAHIDGLSCTLYNSHTLAPCYCGPSKKALKPGLCCADVVSQGFKVFCLQYASMATIDIPQGGSMSRYLECTDLKAAYQVACLGVTEADWKALAQAALQVGGP